MLHSVAIIAVAAIVTLIIRAVPFVAFDGKREVPESQLFPLLFPEFIRNLKESLLWTENHINQQTHWMHRIMESV